MRALLTAILMLGCTNAPNVPAFVPQPESALAPVPYPPPPARVEVLPDSPDSQAVWIDGEWRWESDQWRWVRGRWVHSPKGAKFSPWTSVRGRDGALYYASGVWRDARGAPVSAPKPLLFGLDQPGRLVDGEGNFVKSGNAVDTSDGGS